MNNNKKNVLLIDGSAFAFKYAALEDYAVRIDTAIKYMLKNNNAEELVILIDKSSTNFRIQEAVTKEYKGNRVKYRDPEQTKYLRSIFSYLQYRYGAKLCHGLEVDDILRIISRRVNNSENYKAIICGVDSDLLCIEGTHYNLNTREITEVNYIGEILTKLSSNGTKKKLKATGILATYFKMITGAGKENFQGLPKYGEVKAKSLLENCTTEEEMAKITLIEYLNVFGIELGTQKFTEAFKLCYLLEENVNVITPQFYNPNKGLIDLNL